MTVRRPQPYILARTFQEAHRFARETLGLEHGRYRVCTSAGTIKSIRNCDLILAPGWERRHDGFTMRSAIRWTHMNVIDWAKQQAEEPADGVQDDLEPAGVQLHLVTPDEAHAFVSETSNGDNMVAEGGPVPPENDPTTYEDDGVDLTQPEPETEQAEEPARRRRSRCKACGTLHFKDETCPSEPLPGV